MGNFLKNILYTDLQ